MSINRFYKIPMVVKRKVITTVGGVVRDSLVTIVPTLKGALDKKATTKEFKSDKGTFLYNTLAEMPTSTDILEGDVLEALGLSYDVIFVIDNLYRGHHLEVLLVDSK